MANKRVRPTTWQIKLAVLGVLGALAATALLLSDQFATPAASEPQVIELPRVTSELTPEELDAAIEIASTHPELAEVFRSHEVRIIGGEVLRAKVSPCLEIERACVELELFDYTDGLGYVIGLVLPSQEFLYVKQADGGTLPLTPEERELARQIAQEDPTFQEFVAGRPWEFFGAVKLLSGPDVPPRTRLALVAATVQKADGPVDVLMAVDLVSRQVLRFYDPPELAETTVASFDDKS